MFAWLGKLIYKLLKITPIVGSVLKSAKDDLERGEHHEKKKGKEKTKEKTKENGKDKSKEFYEWPKFNKRIFHRVLILSLILLLAKSFTFDDGDDFPRCNSEIPYFEDGYPWDFSGNESIPTSEPNDFINFCTLEELRYAKLQLTSRDITASGPAIDLLDEYERSVAELREIVLEENEDLEEYFDDVMFTPAANLGFQESKFSKIRNIEFFKYFLSEPEYVVNHDTVRSIVAQGNTLVGLSEANARGLFANFSDLVPPCLMTATFLASNESNPFENRTAVQAPDLHMPDDDLLIIGVSKFVEPYHLPGEVISAVLILLLAYPMKMTRNLSTWQKRISLIKLLLSLIAVPTALTAYWLIERSKLEVSSTLVPWDSVVREMSDGGLCMFESSVDSSEDDCYSDCLDAALSSNTIADLCPEVITKLPEIPDMNHVCVKNLAYQSTCALDCAVGTPFDKATRSDQLKLLLKAAGNPLFEIICSVIILFAAMWWPSSWVKGIKGKENFKEKSCIPNAYRKAARGRVLPIVGFMATQLVLYGFYVHATIVKLVVWPIAGALSSLTFFVLSMCYFPRWYRKSLKS